MDGDIINNRPLHILMISRPFLPMVGGIETVASLLAEELTKLGQVVTVITSTVSDVEDEFDYIVIRKPSLISFLALFFKSDFVLIHGVTLKIGWPSLFRPFTSLIIHHGFLNKHQRFSKLRNLLLKIVPNAAVSKSVAATIPGRTIQLPNPYNAAVFRNYDVSRVWGSLIFVGRIVPEKGLTILIDALAILQNKGIYCPLTIVGDGPQRTELSVKIKEARLHKQVHMLGKVVGKPLAELMNAHHIAVMPSLWPEPFGLVALEAIACGCEVIGTNQGGLPEAIGSCGTVVPNGDAEALANEIKRIITNDHQSADIDSVRIKHLEKFRPASVGNSYLQLIRNMLGNNL